MSDVTTSEIDESPSPLLTLPGGVENVLLSFVSCGDGGLRRILNLRQVCSTTRSWVDNLPKRQADVVFARAQVAMDCDEKSVSRFLVSPPPFGVTALSLMVDALALYEPEEASLEEDKEGRVDEAMDGDEDSVSCFLRSSPPFGVTALSLMVDALALHEPEEEFEESSEEEEEGGRVDEATWSSFCAFWNFKLETLKVKTVLFRRIPFNRRLVELTESPNILRLQFCNSLDLLRQESLTPSCFQKVSELRMGGIHVEDSLRSQFFTQLANNSNLTVLSVSRYFEEDFLGYAKVIDHKKDDTGLHLTFDFESTTSIEHATDPQTPEDQLYREVLAKLAASIVASRSQIRLRLSDMAEFHEVMTELLPPAACRQLYTKIESIDSWTPAEETLSLMDSLPSLQKLTSVDTKDSSVDFDQLTFPPSLEELGFTSGFPAHQRLPQSLTSLRLDEYESDVNSLVSSLNFLSRRCPELTSLRICWKYVNGKSPQLRNFETPPPRFAKLRKLIVRIEIGTTADVGEWRTALLCGFDWRSQELHFLHLYWDDSTWAVADEEILRNLCEGPSAKTLLTIQIENELVTPEKPPLLEKLESLAAENWKEREEREGRGGQWRKIYGPYGWW